MRLTIIPGVLEVQIGRPVCDAPLPKFSKDSLESLAVAVKMLRDEDHGLVRVYPRAVLRDEVLSQLPKELR